MEQRMEVMNQLKGQTSTHKCPECDKPAYCAMEDGKSGNLCWCMQVPSADKQNSGHDTCLCRSCLTDQGK